MTTSPQRQTLPGTEIAAQQQLRSGTARPLAYIVGVIIVAAVVSLFFQMPPAGALALAGVPVAFGVLVWICFYFPRVELSPEGLKLVNLFTTTTLPWPAIDSFDVRFGLSVNTHWDKKYSAWALPGSKRRPEKREGQKRQAIAAHPAAQVQSVLDYFSALTRIGALDDPVYPDRPARPAVNWAMVAAAVIALAWGIVGIVSL